MPYKAISAFLASPIVAPRTSAGLLQLAKRADANPHVSGLCSVVDENLKRDVVVISWTPKSKDNLYRLQILLQIANNFFTFLPNEISLVLLKEGQVNYSVCQFKLQGMPQVERSKCGSHPRTSLDRNDIDNSERRVFMKAAAAFHCQLLRLCQLLLPVDKMTESPLCEFCICLWGGRAKAIMNKSSNHNKGPKHKHWDLTSKHMLKPDEVDVPAQKILELMQQFRL
ncbi:hypothetical protein Anapl_16803 [Anas platyrhynchos]|uniref:Uncharacterized protein n=1 Tax=Anas platyrhynchos TaxID=8839 RepID=R0LYF7_ANAPL|nr:hypothetical protein Anapl_16803 [Anas platyrhynchos]